MSTIVKSSFKHIADYVESGSNCCPACGSPKTDKGKPRFKRFTLSIDFNCTSCKEVWTEHFQLMELQDKNDNFTTINDCILEQ